MEATQEEATALCAAVAELRAKLLGLDLDVGDGERVAALRALADLTNTISAVQARLICDLDRSQRAADEAAEMPERLRRGVTGRVAYALRESPHSSQIAIGVAKALVTEMPHTLAALAAGHLTWHRARLLVAETACLKLADRKAVDRLVCAEPLRLDGVGNRKLAGRARGAAYELDPVSAVRRTARAEADRYVSLRPAPDCMAYLTALLPVAQGVACYATLREAASLGVATGDGRGAGQLMADTLVERVTGQAHAEAVPVGLHLVMTDTALLAGDCAPARIVGHGPVPAGLARRLVSSAPAAASWVKRLFVSPAGLVAGESRARCFPEGLAELIRIRDDTCSTPWCDAPIRHIDHVKAWVEGGPTSIGNGQGLCEQCNHDKQERSGQAYSPIETRHRQPRVSALARWPRAPAA
jgi:hypothetical protein